MPFSEKGSIGVRGTKNCKNPCFRKTSGFYGGIAESAVFING
jgi:hypothetical protein